MYVKGSIRCHINFEFTYPLVTVSLLSTARFQNLKHQDQGISKIYRISFKVHPAV